MKKKSFRILPTLLFVVLCAATGLFLGLRISSFGSVKPSLIGFLLNMLLFFAGVFTQLLLHEGGHLVAGLLTGYGFVSFRIGSWMLVKNSSGFSLKRMGIAGTAGQCLLSPPEKGNACTLYNLGGCLMNLLTALAGAALSRLPGRAGSFFLIFTVMGLLTALTNGIPARVSGVANDGYNARSLKKNPEALEAFYTQLRINAAQMNGLRLRDMPETWFRIAPGADIADPLVSAVAVMRANRLTDEERFSEAREAAAQLLLPETELLGLYRNLLTLDAFCLDVIQNGAAADASPLETRSVKQFMKSMKAYPSVLRTQYGAALRAGSTRATKKYRAAFEKTARLHPAPGEIETERMLLKKLEEKLLPPAQG